jgi:hypothetical protein
MLHILGCLWGLEKEGHSFIFLMCALLCILVLA